MTLCRPFRSRAVAVSGIAGFLLKFVGQKSKNGSFCRALGGEGLGGLSAPACKCQKPCRVAISMFYQRFLMQMAWFHARFWQNKTGLTWCHGSRKRHICLKSTARRGGNVTHRPLYLYELRSVFELIKECKKGKIVSGMRNFAVWVVVALMLFTLFNIFQGPRSNAANNEINFSQFTAQVDAGNIADVTIEGDAISGHYSDGSSFKTFAPPNDPSLVQRLQERGVAITARPDRSGSPTLLGVLISWFPMLLLIGVWVFFMRQMQGGGRGAMGFGKSKAKLLTEAHGRVTFDDVAGIDEAKDDLLEIVEFLKDPAKFQRLGGRIPKGALLVGPPGTGKTLLARAIAGEANVPFFSISGSDFVEMFVGVGSSLVRDMF